MSVDEVRAATVEAWSAAEAVAHLAQIQAVYRAAFTVPPYERREGAVRAFAHGFPRHTTRAGFRCRVIRYRRRVVGFTYGYDSQPGQWWYDQVAPRLTAAQRSRWLVDAFEFVELAVLPDYQGLGLGGRLHDALLAGLAQPTAVLSTLDEDTSGYFLYVRRGWQLLLTGFHFSGVERPYRIMARDL
jgi:ribosomal protein S18 acetylase RimI-like enzyme